MERHSLDVGAGAVTMSDRMTVTVTLYQRFIPVRKPNNPSHLPLGVSSHVHFCLNVQRLLDMLHPNTVVDIGGLTVMISADWCYFVRLT